MIVQEIDLIKQMTRKIMTKNEIFWIGVIVGFCATNIMFMLVLSGIIK